MERSAAGSKFLKRKTLSYDFSSLLSHGQHLISVIMIPVLRPSVPPISNWGCRMKEAEDSRVYSNSGPLVQQLEKRVAEHFGLNEACVVACSNATTGLSAAIATLAIPGKNYCIIPSWTFVATAHAIVSAGLEPVFADVDSDTGALSPRAAAKVMEEYGDKVSLVIPVSVFGAPVDSKAWAKFESDYGVTAIIDHAAGFDTYKVNQFLSVVSLHATKILGIGEGGIILCGDSLTADKLRTFLNFGISGSRIAYSCGLNGKMSEVHAAIGLSALESYDYTRKKYLELAQKYKRLFQNCEAVKFQDDIGEGWTASTLNLSLSQSVCSISENLLSAGIDHRKWWSVPLTEHPAFSRYNRVATPNAEYCASHTLGIPFFIGLTDIQIEYVASKITELVTDS